MNRALFLATAFVTSIFAADDGDFVSTSVDFVVDGHCPPCIFACVASSRCVCGHCVALNPTPGTVVVDCIHGYAYDYLQRRCVAVTCDAATACLSSQTCISEQRYCARDPCPQFKCVSSVSCRTCTTVRCSAGYECKCGQCQKIAQPVDQYCGVGQEYDWQFDRCVTVSCSAANACRDNQVCVPKKLDCVRAPCPQFECQSRRTCGIGEEYDSQLDRCVAVSCSDANACPYNQVCVPQQLDCVRTPCPQFQCQVRPSCGLGEEYDSRRNRCVAVSCRASSACPDNQVCVPKELECIRAPCPQFECHRVSQSCGIGEEYDSRFDRCVAVSCNAANACPRNQVCVSKERACQSAPCPQFECNRVRPTCGTGEQYDTVLDRCVAVSCSAAHACDVTEVCVPQRLHCIRAPCRQFYCRPRVY